MDSERSKNIVRLLNSATSNTQQYYGNDVKTAAQLLNQVLLYESQQGGFDLTAMKDAEFNEVRKQICHQLSSYGGDAKHMARGPNIGSLRDSIWQCFFCNIRTLIFHTQNLVKAGSAILDPENKELWEQIQKTEGGTAHLLRNFEDYANTLAQNVRKTYLKPFTIVTENMSEWTDGVLL